MKRILLAALLAACAGRGRSAPDPTDSRMATPPDAGAPDASPSFAKVNGWGPLRWEMNESEAIKALEDAGMKPKVNRQTAFGQDSNGELWEKESSELVFVYEGLPGSVSFQGERIERVSLTRTVRSAAEVDAVIEELERTYGPPATSLPTQPTGTRARWENDTGALEVNIYRQKPEEWSVYLHFESRSASP